MQHVRVQVAAEVNGPLTNELAHDIAFHDAACVDTLRTGAKLVRAYGPLRSDALTVHCVKVDELELSGNGVPIAPERDLTLEELLAQRLESNTELLRRMREDPHAVDLMDACEKDAELGRMSQPRVLEMHELEEFTLSPRFGVEQGTLHQ